MNNTSMIEYFNSHFPRWDFDIIESPLTGMTTLMAEQGEHTISHTSNSVSSVATSMVESLVRRARSARRGS